MTNITNSKKIGIEAEKEVGMSEERKIGTLREEIEKRDWDYWFPENYDYEQKTERIIGEILPKITERNKELRKVCGMIHAYGKNREIEKERGYKIGENNYQHIEKQVKKGRYRKELKEYSEKEIEAITEGIWDEKYDYEYDYAGATLLYSKYLIKGESPQEAYLAIALMLGTVEKQRERVAFCREVYKGLSEKKISLATPILAGLRDPKANLASCFISVMEDSIESIFREIGNTAQISKNGGGVAINISNIRGVGAPVRNRENASGGILPWVKILNDVGIAVNQGGRRAGAITVSLDSWHIDLIDFLECQTETGDQRRKSYDIFPQIVVSDEFMRRVQNDQQWTLFCPYEVTQITGINLSKLWGSEFEECYRTLEIFAHNKEVQRKLSRTKVYKARDILKAIMKTQIETGLPYIFFKDTANENNPDKSQGYIASGNLCVESFSAVIPGYTSHSCNLSSLNLTNIDPTEIGFYSALLVRILDNTLDLTQPPTAESENHINFQRSIGVGIMGLADYLAKNDETYRSFGYIEELIEDIAYNCYRASNYLARERGAYSFYDMSEWANRKINCNGIKWYERNSNTPERWRELFRSIEQHGMRNCQVMAIAPNTSTSIIQGATASYLPPFNSIFYNKSSSGFAPVIPEYYGEKNYQLNKDFDQQNLIIVTSILQKWVDAGISMELLFDTNTKNAKYLYDCIMKAWTGKVKAIYYIRSIQKDNFESRAEDCSKCAG